MNTRKAIASISLLCPVVVVAQVGSSPAQQIGEPEQKCLLQGRVTNSVTGEPVKKASVRLARRGVGAGAPQSYSATSEVDGTFRFTELEPGDYMLSGQHPGFLDTQYRARDTSLSGTILTFQPDQQITDVNLALIPQAVVSGKIVDQDGDPLSGVHVELLSQTWVRGQQRYYSRMRPASTDDHGDYRIAGLSPGRYYLCAQKTYLGPDPVNQAAISGKLDIRPVRTFYPQSAALTDAAPLEIKAGQDLSGIDVRMRNAPTYHIRGKIAGTVAQDDSARLTVAASPREEKISSFSAAQSNVNPDGTFDLPGIVPDQYTVTLIELPPGAFVRGLGRQSVDMGTTNVDKVEMNIVPSLTVRGHIRVEGNPQPSAHPPDLTNVHVYLGVTGTMFIPGLPPHETAADGTFLIENVFPAKYYVRANAPAGTYLKSIRFEEQEIMKRELDLTSGKPDDLEIVLRYGPAEVAGTVNSGTQAGSPSYATVVLIPKMDPDVLRMRYSNTNQIGAFSIKQVPPGVYRAYAFEDIKVDELQNPDILEELESKGVDLDLKENDNKQLHLTIIPAEAMKQILARLNIGSD